MISKTPVDNRPQKPIADFHPELSGNVDLRPKVISNAQMAPWYDTKSKGYIAPMSQANLIKLQEAIGK